MDSKIVVSRLGNSAMIGGMNWFMQKKTTITGPEKSLRWLLIIIAMPGIVLLLNFLRNSSEINHQFLFGLSKARLAVALLFSSLVLLNIGAILVVDSRIGTGLAAIENRLTRWIVGHPILIFSVLYLAAGLTGITLLILIPPVVRAFAFMARPGVQMSGFILWLFLATSSLAVFYRTTRGDLFRGNRLILALDRFLLPMLIFLTIFFAYEHILIWTGAANQSRYSYWNLLADEFLNGRLYLSNPPQTHDLTSHDGKWYVPMPPLPAILMMPLAYFMGGENINTQDLSIVFSAGNIVLVFLILEQLNSRKWIRLSRVGVLLLLVLLAFGTPHLWVGIRGRAWFVSQIMTVTFLALAVLAALKSWSPWLVGISLGAAIASRPNGIMTWLLVFAMAMQILKEERGALSFRQILKWSLKSALPMGLAIAGSLIYNDARFGNFLDFGYAAINGDPAVVANARTYGLFSPHFILTNLKVIFFYLPRIQPGSQWPVLPSTVGMSIFLTTPPLIYLFHRYKFQWWITGAWVSVFLNFLLLVLYHNTGAHQFGYRYILDLIVPLWALLAATIGEKIRWHFIVLLLLSVVFNIYGTYWFING